jgi:hypothetical protein
VIAEALAAGALGGGVGLSELISRYRDAPGRSLRSSAAALYVLLNVGAAVGALALVRAFGWDFRLDGQTGTDAAAAVARVLVAGFGALALFRSSFFRVRLGEQEVGIGPSALLDALLSAADRSVDRRQAAARGTFIQETGAVLPFAIAGQALPAYCFQLMQNTSAEEERQVADLVRRLREQAALEESVKVRIVLLALLTVVGEKVLREAVQELDPNRPARPSASDRSARARPWTVKRQRERP